MGRALGETGDLEKSWQKFSEAIELARGKQSPTSNYIVEYCKCFVPQWDDKGQLKQQIKKALSIKPPAYVLECLPLFDDIEIFD